MSMNDRLSDMLTRIRNGQRANLFEVRCPASKFLESVLKVLESEGYIRGYRRENISKGRDELAIELKYYEGEAVIKNLRRVSTPGRRVYREIARMKRVHNGLGISILSTSHGVMSDHDAREKKLGGEVLCSVF